MRQRCAVQSVRAAGGRTKFTYLFDSLTEGRAPYRQTFTPRIEENVDVVWDVVKTERTVVARLLGFPRQDLQSPYAYGYIHGDLNLRARARVKNRENVAHHFFLINLVCGGVSPRCALD